MSTKLSSYPGVAFENAHQSRLVIDGHSARWVDSRKPSAPEHGIDTRCPCDV